MKKYCILLLSFVLSLVVSTAEAEGCYLGYCDGQLGTGEAIGQTGNNATVSLAIFIKPDQLASMTGNQITAIRAGLAVGADSYPDSITVWVRSALRGQNLASGRGPAVGGWNEVRLNEAFSVNEFANKGLWVGFSFVQDKKKNIISFLKNDENYADCGWIGKNEKTWTDFSSKLGILPIEALVEGDNLPQHNLTILGAVATPDIIKLGSDIKFTLRVRNNALLTAHQPVISYNIGDGSITGNYTLSQDLSYRQVSEVNISVPSAAITSECELTARFSLNWADGSADENPSDNEAAVVLTFAQNVFPKVLLAEEATGAWCGFCVRGIVGMREMREKYPERFIGIGVHNGDDCAIDNYNSWMTSKINGFPSCLVNRKLDASKSILVIDPNFTELESNLLAQEEFSEAGISVEASLEGNQLAFSSRVVFNKNTTNKGCRVAYVVIEDQVPLSQKNYYSGGSYGELAGFENEPSPVNVLIDDVARGVYPEPAGVDFQLPAQIAKGETYSHSLKVAKTSTVTDWNKCFVVAILLDGQTGEVVNAAKGAITEGNEESAIAELRAAGSETSAYTLYGQPAADAYRGIVIKSGRKIIVR